MTSDGQWWDVPWGVTEGCTPVSEGCEHCWAAAMLRRFGSDPRKVRVFPGRLDKPLHWRKPRRVFVAPRGDLFHEDVPDEFIAQVWGVMAVRRESTFMVLTKRPKRAAKWVSRVANWEGWWTHNGKPLAAYGGSGVIVGSDDSGWPLPNVCLGVTAENQARADERIPVLLEIPAAVRFVSVEPMLSAVDVDRYLSGPAISGFDSSVVVQYHGLDWVICGGETGAGARPMHPEWARELRDQCKAAGVPFFLKSFGEYRPAVRGVGDERRRLKYCNRQIMARVGRKVAGRLLDGRLHEAWPSIGEADSSRGSE